MAYLARFRSPATVDVCHFLRGADAKRMFSALLGDALLGGRSATPHFLETSRLRLHEARKSLLAIFHDMGVLIAWSRGALHMELDCISLGGWTRRFCRFVQQMYAGWCWLK